MSVSGEEESGSGSEGSFEEEDYELVEGIGGASSEEEDGDEDVQVENEDNETIGLEEEGDEDGEPAEGEGSDSGSDVEEEESEDEDGDDTFQTLTKEDTRLEIEKGQAVQHQLRVWDSLLEIRIRLQQILIQANKLPQNEQFQKLPAIPAAIDVKLTVSDLLDNLVELKEQMISNNPETSKRNPEKGKRAPVDNDEEIESSEDDEEAMDVEEDEAPKKKKSIPRTPKRRKLEEYETSIQAKYESLIPFRNSTIQKWNDRTQVASGKFNKKNFSAFQISTLKQIEQILNDRERLIRRTQLKRSNYDIIGKRQETKEGEATPKADAEQDHDPEIFDDDDYYHQLLRELIERKTSNVTDPIQLSRHWLELQKFRSKMKRKVDTKASKARKIRYDVIPKLVNFMAPMDQCPMTEHAVNELFSSLFGQHK